MLGDIPIPITGGAIGLLIFVIAYPYIQMARGALVPRATLQAQERAHERELSAEREEKVYWRGLAAENTAQVSELMEHSRTTAAVLESIGNHAAEGGDPT